MEVPSSACRGTVAGRGIRWPAGTLAIMRLMNVCLMCSGSLLMNPARRPRPRRRPLLLPLFLTLLVTGAVGAQPLSGEQEPAGAGHEAAAPSPGLDCPAPTDLAGRHATVNLRLDNDLFGGRGQDQGYSNGLGITVVSPNLVDRGDERCQSRLARWLKRHVSSLHPGGVEQINLVASVGQGLFTPSARAPAGLIVDDRPYAGVLLASLGYNARQGNRLRSSKLMLGIVGPAARGEQTQNGFHRLMGVDQFNGWDNQLRDEPVFTLLQERLQRHALPRLAGLDQDLILHAGGGLGNLATYLNAGAEWRIGWRLPDDFGSAPVRPAGENTAPPAKGIAGRPLAAHLFVMADGEWVMHDITLDGNTFKSSHRVHKRRLVAELGMGMAVSWHGWKFAFARYFRSREFDGQKDRPFFGSVTVSRQF